MGSNCVNHCLIECIHLFISGVKLSSTRSLLPHSRGAAKPKHGASSRSNAAPIHSTANAESIPRRQPIHSAATRQWSATTRKWQQPRPIVLATTNRRRWEIVPNKPRWIGASATNRRRPKGATDFAANPMPGSYKLYRNRILWRWRFHFKDTGCFDGPTKGIPCTIDRLPWYIEGNRWKVLSRRRLYRSMANKSARQRTIWC